MVQQRWDQCQSWMEALPGGDFLHHHNDDDDHHHHNHHHHHAIAHYYSNHGWKPSLDGDIKLFICYCFFIHEPHNFLRLCR